MVAIYFVALHHWNLQYYHLQSNYHHSFIFHLHLVLLARPNLLVHLPNHSLLLHWNSMVKNLVLLFNLIHLLVQLVAMALALEDRTPYSVPLMNYALQHVVWTHCLFDLVLLLLFDQVTQGFFYIKVGFGLLGSFAIRFVFAEFKVVGIVQVGLLLELGPWFWYL